MRCQDEGGCENKAVVGVGYTVKWVCSDHHDDYMRMVRERVDAAMDSFSMGRKPEVDVSGT